MLINKIFHFILRFSITKNLLCFSEFVLKLYQVNRFKTLAIFSMGIYPIGNFLADNFPTGNFLCTKKNRIYI